MTLEPVTAESGQPHPEQALIDRLRAGDEAAWRALHRRHAGDLYRVARPFVHSDVEAEEVVQEVFLSAYTALDRFRGHARLKTWLYRIAVNRALKRRRWWTRRREIPEEPVSHRLARGVGPETLTADREALALVEACLADLDDRKRTVLVLHELEGLDTREIAEILDCPRSTVLTRLSRARKALIEAARARGVALAGEDA